jgi:hypothetical protein
MTMSDDNEEKGYVMQAVVATDTDAMWIGATNTLRPA